MNQIAAKGSVNPTEQSYLARHATDQDVVLEGVAVGLRV